MPRLFFFWSGEPAARPLRAYDVDNVNKQFVGHVRFTADGVPEFATGWNEAEAPKAGISSTSHPSWRPSRWWFDAFASSNPATPVAIAPCQCGSRRMPQGLGRPVKPFSKPSPT